MNSRHPVPKAVAIAVKALKSPCFKTSASIFFLFFVCFGIKPATKTATILSLYFVFHLSLSGCLSQCVAGFQYGSLLIEIVF